LSGAAAHFNHALQLQPIEGIHLRQLIGWNEVTQIIIVDRGGMARTAKAQGRVK
jgi:deoxyribodipyrimidine photolyase-like uncharacterized protein